MAVPFSFDLSPLQDQILLVMKECMHIARSEISRAVEETEIRCTKQNDESITALRQQILDNAAVLLPILRPEVAKGKSKSDIFLIIGGIAPNVKASVVCGDITRRHKYELVYSNNSATQLSALKKLLGVTMELVQKWVFDRGSTANCLTLKVGEGGIKVRENTPSPGTLQDSGWGTSISAEPSPMVDAWSRSDSSDEGLQLKSTQPPLNLAGCAAAQEALPSTYTNVHNVFVGHGLGLNHSPDANYTYGTATGSGNGYRPGGTGMSPNHEHSQEKAYVDSATYKPGFGDSDPAKKGIPCHGIYGAVPGLSTSFNGSSTGNAFTTTNLNKSFDSTTFTTAEMQKTFTGNTYRNK